MKKPADAKLEAATKPVSRQEGPVKRILLILAATIGCIGCCVFGLSIVADNPMEAASLRSAFPVVFIVAVVVLVAAALVSSGEKQEKEL